MNVWLKMVTALKGGANEMGEAIVDGQALRILDQEVRDASEELKQSKHSLAAMMAQHKIAEKKSEEFKERIQEHEGYAIKALGKNDEALALEVAGKIVDIENDMVLENSVASDYAGSIDQLCLAIKQAEIKIKRLKQQVDTVKATESVQRAQAAVAERYSGSNAKLQTAMESLERIKEKQALNAAQMDAVSELEFETSEASLMEKLEAAGIASRDVKANDILARLKKGAV